MGRPRKALELQATQKVEVLLTIAQLNDVRLAAAQSGLSISAYIRQLVVRDCRSE